MDGATTGEQKKVIRPAASLLIVRDANHGIEVLTLKRSATMRFLPSFLAFPGGTLDGEDWDKHAAIVTGSVVAEAQSDDRAYALGALRECAEEVGWLCGLAVGGSASQIHALGEVEQRHLLENQIHFGDLVRATDGVINLSCLRFVGRWVTPAYMPARFDTRFFVMVASEPSHAVRLVSSENEWVRWCRPSDLLTRIRAGEEQAVPPTIAMLQGLSAYPSAEDCFNTLAVPGPPPED